MRLNFARALLCLLALGGVGLHAQTSTTYQVDIAAQPLDAALKQFAQQSGLQVVFYTDVAAGYRAPAVHGRLTRDEALAALLRNTSLVFREINTNTVEVSEAGRRGERATDGAGVQAGDDGLRLARTQDPAQAAPLADAYMARLPELEEIVVSAQKREERLQEVPVSITVFTREQIRKAAIEKFEDYANFTPGMNVELGGDERSYEVTIRGIGRLGGTANNFGLYLDEFELTGATAANVNADLAEVERIEVLRGPQGTAFGRNVIAGAVNITSIAPSFSGLEGSAEMETANHGGRAARAALNWPLKDGIAALRLSGSYRSTLGDLRNTGPAGQSNDYESTGYRAALRLTPVEHLRIDAAIAARKFEQGRPNTVNDGHLIGVIVGIQQMIDAGRGELPPGSLPSGYPRYFPRQNHYISTDSRGFLHGDVSLATLRAQYDLDSFSLVSVSGTVHSDTSSKTDFDDSPFDLFNNVSPYQRSDFRSTELRAQSNGAGPLRWIGGIYYSQGHTASISNTSFGSDTELVTTIDGVARFPNDTLLFGNNMRGEDESKAVFAELTYRLTPRLIATAGARYNDDRVQAAQVDSWNLLQGGALPDDFARAQSNKMTWRTSLRYERDPGWNYYATFARGYRAGGLQLYVPDSPSYGPEEADNFELGAKMLLLQRRLSLNASVYYTDWRDVQLETFNFSNNRQFTDNVGRARVYGMEIEARATPVSGLELIGGISWLQTRILDYINGVGDSFAGFRLPNTPNFTASAVVDYERPVFGNVKGFVRAAYLHVGNRLESVVDANEQEFLGAYDLVDLRLGLRGSAWMVEAFGQNLFDEIYTGGVLLSGYSLSGSAVTSPRPAFGVRIRKDF